MEIVMAVDFNKPAHILAVHGVQTGENKDIRSHQLVKFLVTRALADSHLEFEFATGGYFYEDINDNAQTFYKLLAKAITSGNPLAGKAIDSVIDLAGDVVTAATNTSTAHKIRAGLRDKILESYRSHNQLVIIAHSLGTVYALDVINELIADKRYFKGGDRRTWPIQGLVTMGSPLGLGLRFGAINIFDQRPINSIVDAGQQFFRWHNYFNRLDPIVSGDVFGKPVPVEETKGPLELRYGPAILGSTWKLRGHAVTSGEQWLMAHTAYWNNSMIGDCLVDMLWG